MSGPSKLSDELAARAPSRGQADQLAAGDAMRRQVLGDEHVDRSRANATSFSRPLQDLVTEYCWGAIWTRPGLEPAVRSLLNLGMLTALGKTAELKLHVRGALNNGCTVEQIQEVLLQAAVYCGVPAALEASRAAQEVVAEVAGE
ncbi:4-carboxymuconolactone decarboxylase [Amycolatopsis deserti]|uniref:4-carboxymuconolactone decarboxylase n=2 Tax=Amycolatopsis deserti TaxID=185696 RepID=A0ABQ3IHZ9_9PSEU|nr:carboxymuconolactone decarboxylase family protein [Amycolatopsis deserti]GHE80765.1 4-carboxymuconolactone decarboxylase [Amycolatopsis deserti]